MFDALQSKLETAFKAIRGRAVITEADVETAMKAVRMALLEADVNFKVAKEFCAQVGALAKGAEVLKSLTPDQQVIKIVHAQLVATMGNQAAELNLRVAPPAVIMMAGLQGSGKTTTSGKLGRWLEREQKRKVLLVPADIYRPAAIQQLTTLGKSLDVQVYPSTSAQRPVEICTQAVEYARNHGIDCVILDTAGRLQIDQELMAELEAIKAAVQPHEILLVADAMTGQEAVNVATGFDHSLGITGLVLTKLDGDARGGAALSMRAVTGKPIKFIGVGEKLDALEPFHPERMASRILGMGDVLSLIEKAVKEVNLDESAALHKKIKKNEFSLDDFLGQLRTIKRMGSVSSLASMIPGMGKMMQQVDSAQADREMKRVEAIILSMTPGERRNHTIIDGSRRRRIASGSGTTVEEVNRLLKQFTEMKKMMKKFSSMGMGGLAGLMGGKGIPGLGGFKGRH
ncbi:MAG: signal recognition particle protein [Oligoflexia bacterium]|nr:signal recognition particle protein [Oligoflexia bacterium]